MIHETQILAGLAELRLEAQDLFVFFRGSRIVLALSACSGGLEVLLHGSRYRSAD